MSSIPPTSNVVSGPIDLANLDIETALMLVQSKRTELLDAQLKDQIAEVQQRNAMTAKLNDMHSKLNAMKATFEHDAKAGAKLEDTPENKQLAKDFAQTALELFGKADPIKVTDVTYNDDGSVKSFSLAKDWQPEKSGIEKMLGEVKSQIDSASNSQQMDMLRLQSLSNKRNEAFEVMTSFVKKMSDSRASIIGNMR